MKRLLMTGLAVVLMLFSACKKENEKGGQYASGTFVVNEGVFQGNNGSVDFYDPLAGNIETGIFMKENLRPLGDVVQSMTVFRDRAYIVVNNSQKVEVVDAESFRSLHTITGVDYPRFFLGIDEGKGYLSDGNLEGQIWKIDLDSYLITGRIPVGKGPEKMLLLNGKVYVLNSGGWSYDSTLSVIDPSTDEVLGKLVVGDQPVDMVVDAGGMIWVLCMGRTVWNDSYTEVLEETSSLLSRVDPASGQVDHVSIGVTGDFFQPRQLAISPDGLTLYVEESGGVYRMGITETSLPAEPFIAVQPYGLEVDPANGEIYVLSQTGADSPGWLRRYHPDGSEIQSVRTGYFPNGMIFQP